MINRDELIDIPERRSVPITEFEVRSTGPKTFQVEGYASIFNKGYEIYGGPDAGGWTEHVNPVAFKRTLASNPDVVLLENHAGGPLARTKSGTLSLSTDSTGLVSSANLDTRDPQAQSVFIKLDRGDYDEMSFAFRVKEQSWSDDETIRSLDEVSLHKGDVSIVNYGANPYTNVGLRSVIKQLANGEFSDEQLVELRAMSAQVDQAMAALKIARDAQDGDDDGPDGDGDADDFADPGYLDADDNPAKGGNGVPRYPIGDKAHAANAAARFAQNKGRYTPAQQEEILGRIHAAEKKFGITPGDGKNSARELITLLSTVLIGPSGGGSGGEARSPSTMSQTDSLNDGDVFDEGEPHDSTLAQAIHDMCADAGADCGTETDLPIDGPMFEPSADSMGRSAEVSVAIGEHGFQATNLSIAEAMRLCRPEGAPEPMTLADAERLAS